LILEGDEIKEEGFLEEIDKRIENHENAINEEILRSNSYFSVVGSVSHFKDPL
jgi:hypothetical protein